MKKYILIAAVAAFFCVPSFAQIDTTGIYGERRDSLEASVAVGRQAENYLSKGKDIRTEVISAAGICKLACCNLAESFENSASVTVGYADAVTGARQIRLLGQNGIYTQMLDENRPTMRGLSAPFGLTFVPGQWLESIQVAKGVTSVINGVESMTGQINLEHRKPDDGRPLFFQASFMDDTKYDANAFTSKTFGKYGKWSTVLLGHVDGNIRSFDHNGDGFKDDPTALQWSFANRWLCRADDGSDIRFGLSFVNDARNGGQMESFGHSRWQADIHNRVADVYFKFGKPLNEEQTRSVALVADLNFQSLSSEYGNKENNWMDTVHWLGDDWDGGLWRFNEARQTSGFVNLIYQYNVSDSFNYSLGLSDQLDLISNMFCCDEMIGRPLNDFGVYGEFTYHYGDKLSAILGLRGDWYNGEGTKFTPRLTMRYAPSDDWIFRLNAGRGIRRAFPLIDNFGVLSSNKQLSGIYEGHPLEDAWTFGANVTWYPGEDSRTFISADYFHTGFQSQVLVDYDKEPGRICFYQAAPGTSYTDNLQLDFSFEPFDDFFVTVTGRYTDARQAFLRGDDWVSREKPMTSKYKAVLNIRYSICEDAWTFDFTASANGPCSVWNIMKDLKADGELLYPNGKTPVYPLLYAQVTRRFDHFEIYAGGENLTNYRQKLPIIGYDDVAGPDFDASLVWGPVSGIKLYAGIRISLD